MAIICNIIMMQHTTNLCIEIESHGSSDGEMEVEDPNKMQDSPSDTTTPLVPKDTAAVGILFLRACNIHSICITLVYFPVRNGNQLY